MQFLVDFISQAIQFFYVLASAVGVANYGIAIIFFTLVVKVILFPLTYQQIKSMRKLQALQPKIAAVQKKYKNNPQKAQQAMVELYQQEGANPLGGCLPLLVQLPILWALFTALRIFFDPEQHPPYVNLDHAGFLWIGNLGFSDPVVLPILVVVSTFVQQWVTMRLTPGTGANDQAQQMQRMMLYIMPLFMGWISRGFPAGLALYWVAYSLLSMLEQVIARRGGGALQEEVGVK